VCSTVAALRRCPLGHHRSGLALLSVTGGLKLRSVMQPTKLHAPANGADGAEGYGPKVVPSLQKSVIWRCAEGTSRHLVYCPLTCVARVK
jgi:hypothetical protein